MPGYLRLNVTSYDIEEATSYGGKIKFVSALKKYKRLGFFGPIVFDAVEGPDAGDGKVWVCFEITPRDSNPFHIATKDGITWYEVVATLRRWTQTGKIDLRPAVHKKLGQAIRRTFAGSDD